MKACLELGRIRNAECGFACKLEWRQVLRQKKVQPLLDKMRPWLDDALLTVVPKTALGKALHYAHNQWHSLIVYLNDGLYPIDNNPVENAIRPSKHFGIVFLLHNS